MSLNETLYLAKPLRNFNDDVQTEQLSLSLSLTLYSVDTIIPLQNFRIMLSVRNIASGPYYQLARILCIQEKILRKCYSLQAQKTNFRTS